MSVDKIEDEAKLVENFTAEQKREEGALNSFRILMDDDILKKVNIIASLKDIDGKKNEIVQKVIEIAVEHYFKDVAVKELQKL